MTNKVFVSIFSIVFATAVVISVLLSGKVVNACGWFSSCDTEESKASEIQKTIASNVPIPPIKNSMERANVARRAVLFDSPDKISYIYLVSYGRVMAFYTVKGKVSSLRSYMVPTQKIIHGDGTPCNYDSCNVVDAPDIDGTYGENVEGIFFFTTEGAYVEWKGSYMMSDEPLKLSTQPELIRTIK